MIYLIITLIVVVFSLILFPSIGIKIKEIAKRKLLIIVFLASILFVISAFLYFPLLFKAIAVKFWEIPLTVYKDGTVEVVELADLGPIGDIFGSLNSFISSIALCAVAFSTWLQVTSLRETRIANNEQIKQAKEVHDSQMLELRKTILLNHFYNLLTLKNEYLKSLILDNGVQKRIGNEFFEFMYQSFKEQKRNVWQDLTQVTRTDLEDAFRMTIQNNNQGVFSGNWLSYFCIHTELNKILNNPELSIDDKNFLRSILRNSMTPSEQGTLLWIASFSWRIASGLESSYICVHLTPSFIGEFAARFLFKSFWGLEQIRELVPLEHPQENDYP